MKNVTMITPEETVRLNAERLGNLFSELGDVAAGDVVCRAMEELSQRLTEAERLYLDAQFVELRKKVRSLIAIADQVGMHVLAEVAGTVIECIDRGDPVALAATLARLMRIAEQSLTAAWNMQGLSI